MHENLLRIATRRSPLAVWQAEYVRDRLLSAYPALRVELVRMSTQGDKIVDSPLTKIGGKGLFVKELEEGLLNGQADLAVHSMKDVPVGLPPGLHVPVVCTREDPRDALISDLYRSLDTLPKGARIGTSSLRRQSQLKALRPDLEVLTLRGNVHTRLAKLKQGDFDAIILAAAGLKRLGYEQCIGAYLSTDVSLPAIGQGAIGIECRSGDARVHGLIAVLDDPGTRVPVAAERAFNHRLNGGCQVPVAGHAVLEDGQLWLRGLVGRPDGGLVIRGEIRGPDTQADALGWALAEELLCRGADAILNAVYAGS